MNRSISCSQSVKHICAANPLTDMAAWRGRDGQLNKYWHGNGEYKEGCQCFIYKNCTKTGRHQNACNCDGFGNDAVDAGDITSLKNLPITQMIYGSINTFGKINYYLGPLECTGKNKLYRSEIENYERKKILSKLSFFNETLLSSFKTLDGALNNYSMIHDQEFKIMQNQIDKEISLSHQFSFFMLQQMTFDSKLKKDVEKFQ